MNKLKLLSCLGESHDNFKWVRWIKLSILSDSGESSDIFHLGHVSQLKALLREENIEESLASPKSPVWSLTELHCTAAPIHNFPLKDGFFAKLLIKWKTWSHQQSPYCRLGPLSSLRETRDSALIWPKCFESHLRNIQKLQFLNSLNNFSSYVFPIAHTHS